MEGKADRTFQYRGSAQISRNIDVYDIQKTIYLFLKVKLLINKMFIYPTSLRKEILGRVVLFQCLSELDNTLGYL